MSHADHSLTIRAAIRAEIGALGRVVAAIGDADGQVGGVDIVAGAGSAGEVVRDITVMVADPVHAERIRDAVEALECATVLQSEDRVFRAHHGGKMGMRTSVVVNGRDDLAMAYTPGVARVCMAIHEDFERAWDYTIKGSSVMVVSDGSSVVGQGDLGPLAALPALEAKAAFLKTRAGIDAFPLPVTVREPSEIADVVARCASVFAGIHLSDIAAPRCFEVQRLLAERLDIPVFHDDQQGTAAVILAGLTNGLAVSGKELGDATVVLAGLGPGGLAVARLLLAAGVGDLIACDSAGAVTADRTDLTHDERDLAARSNREGRTGAARDLVAGADAFIGLSAPELLTAADVATMAADPVVFALATPHPEVRGDQAAGARVYATGRPDVPNQINSSLASPGIWRGALDCRATTINDEMTLAAASAIAATAMEEAGGLSELNVVPSFFNDALVPNVAAAVRAAAEATGVARTS